MDLYFLAHVWLFSTHVCNVRRESSAGAMSSVPACLLSAGSILNHWDTQFLAIQLNYNINLLPYICDP